MPTNRRTTEERSVVREPDRQGRVITFKATQVVWLLFGILEALIAIRFFLKLIGANPASPIVSLIYAFTTLFLWPFEGITATPTYGNFVLETPSLIALMIYALVAWAIERIIWVIFYKPRGPVEEITETTTHEDRHP